MYVSINMYLFISTNSYQLLTIIRTYYNINKVIRTYVRISAYFQQGLVGIIVYLCTCTYMLAYKIVTYVDACVQTCTNTYVHM